MTPQLRSLFIVRKSGILLFNLNFDGSPQQKRANGVGALMTTLVDLTVRSVGINVSYIQTSSMGITIEQSEEVGVLIILFHDHDYGKSLARCIALEILRSFLDQFDPAYITREHNTINFKRFSASLGATIRAASFTLLHSLIDRLNNAIQFAIIFSDTVLFTYPSNTDAISVAANLQQLQFALQEVATLMNDSPYELIVEGQSVFSHIILFGGTTVVLQIRAEYHSPEVISEVNSTLAMLDLCFSTSEGLLP